MPTFSTQPLNKPFSVYPWKNTLKKEKRHHSMDPEERQDNKKAQTNAQKTTLYWSKHHYPFLLTHDAKCTNRSANCATREITQPTIGTTQLHSPTHPHWWSSAKYNTTILHTGHKQFSSVHRHLPPYRTNIHDHNTRNTTQYVGHSGTYRQPEPK